MCGTTAASSGSKAPHELLFGCWKAEAVLPLVLAPAAKAVVLVLKDSPELTMAQLSDAYLAAGSQSLIFQQCQNLQQLQ